MYIRNLLCCFEEHTYFEQYLQTHPEICTTKNKITLAPPKHLKKLIVLHNIIYYMGEINLKKDASPISPHSPHFNANPTITPPKKEAAYTYKIPLGVSTAERKGLMLPNSVYHESKINSGKDSEKSSKLFEATETIIPVKNYNDDEEPLDILLPNKHTNTLLRNLSKDTTSSVFKPWSFCLCGNRCTTQISICEKCSKIEERGLMEGYLYKRKGIRFIKFWCKLENKCLYCKLVIQSTKARLMKRISL